MPTTLYLTPTLETAAGHAVAQVQALHAGQPGGRAWFVLPAALTPALLRRRLGEAGEGRASPGRATSGRTPGARIFSFYSLAEHVLEVAGRPTRPLGEMAARRVVRLCLQEMQAAGELRGSEPGSFARVAGKPGFVQALIQWLREMKSLGIPPEQVREHVQPLLGERDRQLAAFYARYQDFLRARALTDIEGLLWLAVEALEGDPRLLDARRGPALFQALGFDQLNPLQLRLLDLLAGRLPDTRLYLPWDASRPPSSLPTRRVTRTRAILEAALSPAVIELEEVSPPAEGLLPLRRAIFEPEAGAQAEEQAGAEAVAQEEDSSPAIAFLEAPSRESEVRHALRRVKRLLQDGQPPEEIAVLVPQLDAYARLVENIAAEYELPVSLDRRLSGSPLLAALLNLLRLAPDFPRRAVLDALHSPYVRQPWLDGEAVARLEILSRERPVTQGRAQWRFALLPLDPSLAGEGDEDLGPPRLAAALPPGALEALQAGLEAFFDHLTPPPFAAYADYARWVEEKLLGPPDEQVAPHARWVEEKLLGPPDEQVAPHARWVEEKLLGPLDGQPATQALWPEEELPGPPAEQPAPGAAPHLGMAAACQIEPFAARDMAALETIRGGLRSLVEAAALAPLQGGGAVSWETFRGELAGLLPGLSLLPERPAGMGVTGEPGAPETGAADAGATEAAAPGNDATMSGAAGSAAAGSDAQPPGAPGSAAAGSDAQPPGAPGSAAAGSDAQPPGAIFAPLSAGRWISVAHLFILGLSEGEFPRPPAPDPFYSPAERMPRPEGAPDPAPSSVGAPSLGPHPLPLNSPLPGEEAGLFWQALANCRGSLTLLRPRLDDKGVPWLPSPYWEAAHRLAPASTVKVIPIADDPPLEEAVSLSERLVALASAPERAGDLEPAGGDCHARKALRSSGQASLAMTSAPELAETWAAARAAAGVLIRRQGEAPIPAFEGRLQQADLLAGLARRYGPGSRWSASRLNQYGACPFQYFAAQALDLRPLADPEEGLDAMPRGQLLHAVLEALYRRLGQSGLAPCPAARDAVLEHLEACCDDLLPRAPERFGFRPGPLWRYEQDEIRAALRRFVSWECDQNGDPPAHRPYRQELRFGLPGSALGPLPLEVDGGEVFVHGVIDRIDQDAAGRLRVLDYKSSAATISARSVAEGLALQAALYALAVERLLSSAPGAAPVQVIASEYLHIAGTARSGLKSLEEGSPGAEALAQAAAQAANFVGRAGRGLFPTLPAQTSGALACRRCAFGALCRKDRAAIRKARRMEAA